MRVADTVLVKKPHLTQNFTNVQVQELARCMTDPIYFIETYCNVQHPVKGRMKFNLYPFQKELIEVYNDFRYSIAMLPRQTGKSTTAAAYLLWYAMFKPDSTILVASNKYLGASEIMTRLRFAYETLPEWIKAGATSYNKGSIEFDNGSRIVAQATTENTGRGMSLTLVYLDEFAFVPPRIANEFWTSLSPTLATGGKCIITSTPNQDNDQFAQIWKASNPEDEYGNITELGKNGFKRYMCHWSEHPDRDDDWAENERQKIGEERFRREHNCEFITADETLINPLKLVTMEGVDPVRVDANIRWYQDIYKDKIYAVALDPSFGTGSDYAAIEVFSLPDMVQVAEWQNNKTDMKGQLQVLQLILQKLNETIPENHVYWSLENNGVGRAVVKMLMEMGEENFPGSWVHDNPRKARGLTTTLKTKVDACARLKYFVEHEKIKILSRNLTKEIKTFVAHGPSFAAKEGEHDDLVMSTLLITIIINYVMNFEADVYSKLADSIADDDIIMPMPIAMI